MTGVYVIAVAFLVKAFAMLLPPAGQFLGEVQQVRDWSARRRAPQPAPPAGAQPAPEFFVGTDGRTYQRIVTPVDGVAPAPVDWTEPPRRGRQAEGPTSATVPSTAIGDVDAFDLDHAPETERPIAAGSKLAAKPPGPPIEGEQ